MTTAEKLKSLTDRALFETIANAYLRQHFPLLANLIAAGINEKGETVKGKLDSFTKSGHNHFALVEHTTNDSGLEAKWLYDKNNYKGKRKLSAVSNGDLLKAIEQAEIIRSIVPEATFTIFLTTNQSVSNDLWFKVIERAKTGQVDVEILELSAIAHFLDNDPSGQYLRKQHLQIEQELLSEELFSEIQQKNLEQFRKDSFVSPVAVISHWQLDEVENVIKSSPKILTLLVADSGLGKTTLCYSMLKDQMTLNERVLWVTPDAVRNASDPVHLIEETIRYYNQGIFFNHSSRSLLTKRKILIVVDDVNKSDNPPAIINKLISWGMDTGNEDTQHFSILCPVWPKFFYEITEAEKKEEGFNYLLLERPSTETSKHLITQGLAVTDISLTLAEIQQLAEMNGNDPLLMGLNIQIVKKRGHFLSNQGNEVIGNFISDKLTEVSLSTRLPDFKQKLLLKHIGTAMITHKKVGPTYTDCLGWFDKEPGVVTLIDALGYSQELFLIKENGKIQFRHDRIRDYIIAEGFKVLLEKVGENIIFLSEPVFAENLAMALVGSSVSENELDQIIELNPEAIFNSLKYLQGPGERDYFDKMLAVIDRWKNSDMFPSYNKPMMDAIYWILLYTDTKEIIKITHGLPDDRFLHLALYRNGDAIGGINFLISFSDFEPFWGNRLRDVMVNHAKSRHLPQLKKQLLKLIEKDKGLGASAKAGIFLLAGYLKLDGIAVEMKAFWEEDMHPDVFIYYLWAMINCANLAEEEFLKVCFDHFQSLAERAPQEERFSKRAKNTIVNWYAKCRWSLKTAQIELLNRLYDQYPQLISSVFGRIDHPLAIERTVANLGSRSRGGQDFNYFSLFSDERWSYKKNKYRLSNESRDYLKSAWQNLTNPNGVRKLAYSYWSGNEEGRKVTELSGAIDINDNILYEESICKRVELKDKSVTNEFFQLVRKMPHLVGKLQHIWNEDCKVFYNDFLLEQAAFLKNQEFSHDFIIFLVDLPPLEAEEILKKNWNLFKGDPFAVQTALYLATPDMIRLVAESLKDHPDPKKVFQYIDLIYNFLDSGNYKISLEQLITLEPYLPYIEDVTLRWMTEYCFKAGFKEWALTHVDQYLKPEDQKHFNPDVGELVEEIRKFNESGPRLTGIQLLNDFKYRGINRQMALAALEEFSKIDSSPNGLELLAHCLTSIGNRDDLNLLDNYKDFEFPGVNKQHLYDAVRYAIKKRTPL
jgi:hypothetical protein